MHVRPYLALLLSALLCLVALGAAAVAAQPAAAGTISGTITDQYQNPLGGILVEALDSVSRLPVATGTTDPLTGTYSVDVDATTTPSGSFAVRFSDPTGGVFTTAYYRDAYSTSPTFDLANIFGCT